MSALKKLRTMSSADHLYFADWIADNGFVAAVAFLRISGWTEEEITDLKRLVKQAMKESLR